MRLLRDNQAAFTQWFCFDAVGAAGRALSLRIENAGDATYADAFEGYRACASYDGERWFRVATGFDGQVLTIEHVPVHDRVTYAYFAAYPEARRRAVLERAMQGGRCVVERIGASVEGRPIDVLTWGGADDGRPVLWFTARQHPGETMAEWFAEGLIERLSDDDDPWVAALLERAAVRVVSCVNPDGGVLGNQRTNAAGADLNRCWAAPDEATSPEVLAVRARIEAEAPRLFVDVHGDERTPYVFAAGNEGNPGYDGRLAAAEGRFAEALVASNVDFQREHGYPPDPPGEGDLTAAANWVGERFGCLALTLEMPFRDNANRPDEAQGWSPERSRRLARDTLEAALACLGDLP
jgi:murein tripeptide amidase MpaA